MSRNLKFTELTFTVSTLYYQPHRPTFYQFHVAWIYVLQTSTQEWSETLLVSILPNCSRSTHQSNLYSPLVMIVQNLYSIVIYFWIINLWSCRKDFSNIHLLTWLFYQNIHKFMFALRVFSISRKHTFPFVLYTMFSPSVPCKIFLPIFSSYMY